MQTEPTLPILREKIYKIRSALMYSMSNELIKMPNSIVNVLRVDDEGQLWFLSKRPQYPVSEFEESFPARLVFYRKGISFRLEVSGKATIVKDEGENLFPLTTGDEKEAPVLIKMNMNNLQVTERKEKPKPGKFHMFVERSCDWLVHVLAIPRHDKPVLQKLSHIH
jgi:hypothetical protein